MYTVTPTNNSIRSPPPPGKLPFKVLSICLMYGLKEFQQCEAGFPTLTLFLAFGKTIYMEIERGSEGMRADTQWSLLRPSFVCVEGMQM